MYEVKFHPDVKAQIKEMPRNVRNHLRSRLETVVAADPMGCSEGLTGDLADFRSFHFGEYRIVYRVLDRHNLVVVLGIGKKNAAHYTEIYRTLEEMAKAGKVADSILKNLKMIQPS